MDRVLKYIWMALFIKDNGKIIKEMGKALFKISISKYTRDNGRMVLEMALANKHILNIQLIQDTLEKTKDTEKASYMKTNHFMKVNL